jgi:hypothetical protein
MQLYHSLELNSCFYLDVLKKIETKGGDYKPHHDENLQCSDSSVSGQFSSERQLDNILT